MAKSVWYLERISGRCDSLCACFVRAETKEEAIAIAKANADEKERVYWDRNVLVQRIFYEGAEDFLLGVPLNTVGLIRDIFHKLTMLSEGKDDE